MRLKIHLDRMEYEFFNKKGQNFNSALLNPVIKMKEYGPHAKSAGNLA
jgi:hypothetical protein